MRVTAVVTAALALSACAHSVKEIARESSGAAVDQSITQLTDEHTKQQAQEAAQDPRVEAALMAITDHVTEGVLKSLESERAHKQVAALTATATRAAAEQLLATLGSAPARQRFQELTDGVMQVALDDVGKSLSGRFVPGLRDALQSELERDAQGPGGPLHQVIGNTAHTVAYHAVLGADQGLRSSWLGTGAVGDVRRLSSFPWLSLVLGAAALLTLSVLGAAVIVVARARRARSEVLRLESATLLLATAMRERHGSQESDEIVAVVRDALEQSARERQRHGLLGALRLRNHHAR